MFWLPWAWAATVFAISLATPREYRVWLWHGIWSGLGLTGLVAWMLDRRLGPRVVVFQPRPVVTPRNDTRRD